MGLGKLSLVLGGAASGKSARAEALIVASGLSRVYFATAQAFDDEMEDKILRHQEMRGPDWRTVEEPLDIAAALEGVREGEAVLLDCVTLWLSNHLLEESDLEAETERLLAALEACPAPVVVVSNEAGMGVVPDTSLGRRFRNAQGRLNQELAAKADLVMAVMAGLPMVLKGRLPEGPDSGGCATGRRMKRPLSAGGMCPPICRTPPASPASTRICQKARSLSRPT